MAAAARKPHLSLWNQTGPLKRRRGESQTRSSPLHGNGSVRRRHDPAPSATAGRNQARRGNGTGRNFALQQGPAAREELKHGTVFCAPELLWKGVGITPVNGGPGVAPLEPGGDRGTPPAAFCLLCRRGQRRSPKGRNPPLRDGGEISCGKGLRSLPLPKMQKRRPIRASVCRFAYSAEII
jgi:hypothetical protein